jgi:hypothetical protein
MSERGDLLTSIATTIGDYRKGEIPRPTPQHVDLWVKQFAVNVQIPLLREMDRVLGRTYFSFEKVTQFLRHLIGVKNLVGDDPCNFWRNTSLLDIQKGGNSQTEIVALFDELLKERCGFGIDECGDSSSVYVYLDDAIFTGNRVRQDLESWIADAAPSKATVHIVAIALHSGGQYYASGKLNAAAKSKKKTIQFRWGSAMMLEDQRINTDSSDVLRPAVIPDDAPVVEYVKSMLHKPHLRKAGQVGAKAIYSGDEGRQLLEQEFLKAGVRIRQMCPNLNKYQRPLGNSLLETLGFGSLIVSFRNCPNNAPLALWVGDPWYPLFPRTTNSQTAIKRMFADLTKSKD